MGTKGREVFWDGMYVRNPYSRGPMSYVGRILPIDKLLRLVRM